MMKNKKQMLLILIGLISALALTLVIVFVVGRTAAKKKANFYKELESTTCKMADELNYTESICEVYTNLCRIKYSSLIKEGYLDENKENPVTKEKVKDNKKNYIEIVYENGQKKCIHKEG